MKWNSLAVLLTAVNVVAQPVIVTVTNGIHRITTIVEVVNQTPVVGHGVQSPQFLARFPRIDKSVSRISERTAALAGLPIPPEIDQAAYKRVTPNIQHSRWGMKPNPVIFNGKIVRMDKPKAKRFVPAAGMTTDYEPVIVMTECCTTVYITTDGVATYGIDYSTDLRNWNNMVTFDPGTHPAGSWGYGYIRDDVTYPNIFFRSWRY